MSIRQISWLRLLVNPGPLDEKMMKIAEALIHAQQLLPASDTARLDADVLLAAVLGCDRSYFFTWPEKILDHASQKAFFELVRRRAAGEPVAYLLGKKEFWSIMLSVDSSTLIPRPETELLVELALQKFPDKKNPDGFYEALDLGTGSGAIAIALASERPQWQIMASDISRDAIHLAQQNVRAHGIRNVSCLVSDWFSGIHNKMFDLVVSNPPYIDPLDPHLLEGDLKFEPNTALVSAEQGFADIEKIVRCALDYLKPDGWLMLEHGFGQAAKTRLLLCELSYESVETFHDMAGLERVTTGKLPAGYRRDGR